MLSDGNGREMRCSMKKGPRASRKPKPNRSLN